MSYPGLLLFHPIPVPPLPEPYLSGDPVAIYKFSMNPASAYDHDFLQKLLNHQAVESGNKQASIVIRAYNSQVYRYYQNGGKDNKYGFVLPSSLPVLEASYPPAMDATVQYVPPTKPGQAGTWAPDGKIIATKPWSLPVGTVLYTLQA